MILVVAPYLDCKPLPYSVYFECYALCQALARLGGVIRPGLAAEVRQQLVCRAVLSSQHPPTTKARTPPAPSSADAIGRSGAPRKSPTSSAAA